MDILWPIFNVLWRFYKKYTVWQFLFPKKEQKHTQRTNICKRTVMQNSDEQLSNTWQRWSRSRLSLRKFIGENKSLWLAWLSIIHQSSLAINYIPSPLFCGDYILSPCPIYKQVQKSIGVYNTGQKYLTNITRDYKLNGHGWAIIHWVFASIKFIDIEYQQISKKRSFVWLIVEMKLGDYLKRVILILWLLAQLPIAKRFIRSAYLVPDNTTWCKNDRLALFPATLEQMEWSLFHFAWCH